MTEKNQSKAVSVEKLLQIIGQLTIEKQLMIEQIQALQQQLFAVESDEKSCK